MEFLDKEIEGVLPKSRRRAVDMLVKAQTRRRVEPGRRERLVLLHVEIQAGMSRAELGRRMHRYFHRILDRFEMPVVPIALYLQLHGDGIGWQSYDLTYWGQCFNHFEFAYVALPGLAAEKYLAEANPLAWALTGLMSLDPSKRVWVKAEALRRVQKARLAQSQRQTLIECLETYTPLDEQQQSQFDALIATREYAEVQEMVRSTFDVVREEGRQQGRTEGRAVGRTEGRAEGRAEGQAEILIRLLEERFGTLPQRVRQRLLCLTEAEARDLAAKVLHAQSLKELGI